MFRSIIISEDDRAKNVAIAFIKIKQNLGYDDFCA